MNETFELFSKNIKKRLETNVAGEVTVWFVDDELHIKIYNHGLKFRIVFQNLTAMVVYGRVVPDSILATVLKKYRTFIMNTYFNQKLINLRGFELIRASLFFIDWRIYIMGILQIVLFALAAYI